MSEQLGQALPSDPIPQVGEQETPISGEGAAPPERTTDEPPSSTVSSSNLPSAVVTEGDSLPLDRDPLKPVKFGMKMNFKKR
jgi:hypothetical protein